MENLVAYDADSDEDMSPRRRSTEATTVQWAKEEEEKKSSERRQRRDSDMYDFSPTEDSDHSESNFAEPPPPKRMVDADHSPSPAAFRTPQNAMPHTSSQVSLVSYSGDNEDDIGPVKFLLEDSEKTPQSELHEPKPPARKEEIDEDEEERLIDLALEESKKALKNQMEDSPGSKTPTPGPSQQGSPALPREEIVEHLENDGTEIRIPPPPECEVSERLQATFEAAFHQKNRGVNLNQQMQARQDFSNPMSYERFIEMFEIDEKGTNFSKNIFDPHCFPENCFYDAISEEQRKLMEAQQAGLIKKITKS
ncbi:unnamed protein product [Caenorhabditis angaria]|uniref:Uncharacterized protein n=1 Tax=Caenorhabditis angaria TaxID=860376 RepID=A0A9P1IK83_9PELO|nr:unnamed protein product [Caenorhabditis angaria]